MNRLSQKNNLKPFSFDSYQMAVLLMIMIAQVLISWLLFQSKTSLFLYVLCTLMGAVTMVLIINFYQLTILLKPLIVTISGGIGMLLGSIIDFDQFGLLMLSTLCRAVVNSNSLESITQMIILAPWTHIGMWLSCSVSLLIVESRYPLLSFCNSAKHLLCLLGMFLGMLFIHALPINSLPLFSHYPVVMMWLGMSAGMFSFYLFFDAIIAKKDIDVIAFSND